jgi:hypothetical protein
MKSSILMAKVVPNAVAGRVDRSTPKNGANELTTIRINITLKTGIASTRGRMLGEPKIAISSMHGAVQADHATLTL